MNAATAVLGSALRVVASSAAASSLRHAAGEAKKQILLAIVAGMAMVAGLVCLSSAAFIVLRDRLGAAEAWLAVGIFYLLIGAAVYFAGQFRPRR